MFEKDPNIGLGKDKALFMQHAKKVPMKSVLFSLERIDSRECYKNLTTDEKILLARLINVKIHSTFSMFDLKTYFSGLSKSRG